MATKRLEGERLLEAEKPLAAGVAITKARAEANLKKEERAKDGAEAMKEYLADSRKVRERMAKLKALRLAKEMAESQAAGTKTGKKAAVKAGKKAVNG